MISDLGMPDPATRRSEAYGSEGTHRIFGGLEPEAPSSQVRMRVLAVAGTVAAGARRRRRRVRLSLLGMAAGAVLAVGLWLGMTPSDVGNDGLVGRAPPPAPKGEVRIAPGGGTGLPTDSRLLNSGVNAERETAAAELRRELEEIRSLAGRLSPELTSERREVSARLAQYTRRLEQLEQALSSPEGPRRGSTPSLVGSEP